MLKHYLKTAWRNLLRQPVNSLINVAGLSIGMAAAILIFLWVKNELTFDDYHSDGQQIFRVKNYLAIDKNDTWVWENSPYLLGEHAKEQIPEVLNVCRLGPMIYNAPYFNIKGQFTKEAAAAYVDAEWFNVFKYEFIYGTKAAFNEHPFSLLLTESKAKKYFGNENPVGKIIRIDTLDYQVQGVLRDNAVNSSFQYDLFIPLAARQANLKNKSNDESWGNFNYLTFLKLTPAASPQLVAGKLKNIIAKQRDKDNLKIGLTAIKDMRFENDLQNSVFQHTEIKVVYIFAVLGILLLLIACINYVNLTTARATLRAKEVSVKKIVGAGKKQLFAQFIIESALISVIALLLTICIAQLALPFFNRFTEKNFVLSFTSPGLWIIIGSTLFATIVLTSIYPAILLSSFKPLSIFRGLNLLQIKDSAVRKGLVVFQFTISIILIVGTIVIYRQLQFISQQNSAYNRSQLMSFSIPYKVVRKAGMEKLPLLTSSIKKELLSESNVADVSVMSQESIIDMQGFSSGDSNDWDGRAKDFMPAIAFFYVDTNFKKLVNLQMKEGRWYQPGNISDQHNSILNETAVKAFNIRKPVIGQRFVRQGDTGVIVGVVKDFYYKSLHDKIGPVVISTADENNRTFLIKAASGKIGETVASAEKVWKQFFPNEPFEYSFLNDEFEKIYRADRKSASLIWIFSGIAIFISCLGLFGLAAFTAERRNKEIGIRKILGAGLVHIVSLLSREFILMVLFAMIVAFPVAWLLMNKWLENFAYKINIGWWIFLLAGIIALLIALVTVSFQAIKAAVANPVNSLRTE
jgi:ABC-type antimicrobial peptide transport system permease subunit